MIQDTPLVESDIFLTLKRIDEKITHLNKILAPILVQTQEKVGEVKSGTKLSNDLHRIEDRITTLLDTINL